MLTALRTRAAELIQAGYRPVPLIGKQLAYSGDTPERDYAPEHFKPGMRIQIRAGLQKDGTYIYGFDLEGPSHGEQYDAEREWQALQAAVPQIARKLTRARSTSGDGWWLIFRAYKTLHGGQLYDGDRKIGDFIGVGGTERVPDPGDAPIAILSITEIEQLFGVWTAHSSERADGERWADRAKEGARYTSGWQRLNATRPMLRAALIEHCGQVGKHLEALFDEPRPFDRSAAAGNLMQCLMLHAHRLAPNGGFTERCRIALAYWMAADSYGKGSDKDYNPEKDGPALVAKIVNGDTKPSGGQWKIPFWAGAHPTPPPAPAAPEAAPRRLAHRPAGDRDRMRRKIQRYLELRAFEDGERLYYDVDDLAACFKIARRTMQTYLRDLQDVGLIKERKQDPGPGGRAWLIWGADNSEKTAESADKSAPIWGADSVPIERIATPQSEDRALYAKEDHQNTSAPAPAQPGAAYDPCYDWTAGGRLQPFIDPTVPRLRPSLGDTLAPHNSRRAPKHRAQQTFTRQDGVLKQAIARRQPGPVPAPSPHRPRAGLPLESLPDVVGSGPAAPLGAGGSGDLLSAPAGAPPAPSGEVVRQNLYANLRARKAA